ncbi:MAG: NDP-sugar synthase, partial [Ilumatobacteraceae bacterium]
DPSAFGVVEVGADGRVERFVEKPAPGDTSSNLINAGTYVFEPSVLHRIPAGRPASVERETFPAVVADGGLFALATEDYWTDTGRPDLYLAANLEMLSGRRPERCDAVAVGASVATDATLEHSVVESGATVGPGARLVGSVVLAGADVGEGATVERSIVMGRIGAGAVVSDAVIGGDGEVPAGARVADVRIPEPG